MWSKFDDGFPDHPKVLAAGPAAAWLYVCGVCYSNRLMTDGFIPARQVRRLADVDDMLPLAERLCEVGLWEEVEGGYRIHDFLDYNFSAQEARDRKEHISEVRAEAGRKGSAARWGGDKGSSDKGEGDSKTDSKHSKPDGNLPDPLLLTVDGKTITPSRPHPVPVKESLTRREVVNPTSAQQREKTAPPLSVSDNFAAFAEEFWQEYPPRKGKKLGKKPTLGLLRKIPSRDWDEVMAATRNYASSSTAIRGYAKDPERFLAADYWRDWLEPEKEDAHERTNTNTNGNGNGRQRETVAQHNARVARDVFREYSEACADQGADNEGPHPGGEAGSGGGRLRLVGPGL